MNFQLFKTELESLVFIPNDEDKNEYLNDLYIDFKEMPEYENVKEWALFWFQENETNTHSVYLKSKIQTNLSLNIGELTIFLDLLSLEREEHGLSPEESEIYNKLKYFLEDNKSELEK